MDNGIIAIISVSVTLAGSIIKDCINNRNKLAIEKLRIHDKDKVEAYKRLFIFSRKVINSTFPLAEHKENDFRCHMESLYKNKLEFDYPYFNSDIREILDIFENKYVCMTSPDLVDVTQDETKKFIEEDVFSLASKLKALSEKQL